MKVREILWQVIFSGGSQKIKSYAFYPCSARFIRRCPMELDQVLKALSVPKRKAALLSGVGQGPPAGEERPFP